MERIKSSGIPQKAGNQEALELLTPEAVANAGREARRLRIQGTLAAASGILPLAGAYLSYRFHAPHYVTIGFTLPSLLGVGFGAASPGWFFQANAVLSPKDETDRKIQFDTLKKYGTMNHRPPGDSVEEKLPDIPPGYVYDPDSKLLIEEGSKDHAARSALHGEGVTVGRRVKIGRHVVLMDNTTVADLAQLHDNAVLEPGATVHTRARVENRCTVGAGATIGRGAILRTGCVVEPGALVPPRTVVPPKTVYHAA